jgi:glucosamine kinase
MYMTEKIVLGIDGGGTSTRAVLSTATGVILGKGRSGSSNYDDVGVEKAQENIHLAVEQAWRMANQAPRPADAVFLGMAGVVSEPDQAIIKDIAVRLNLAPPAFIGVDHDIRIALAGGLALHPGIVVIAGTGSSCYGRTAAGLSLRVGGWGHLLDDGGSSYTLGLDAIRAVVRSADGRLGATILRERIMATLGLVDDQEIMHRIYHPQISAAEIAGLAPLVMNTAQQGDAVALRIVQEGQNELALLVQVAARQLNFQPEALLVTVTGGLAQSGEYFKSGLYAAIRARVPGVTIQEPMLSSVLGAVLLAIQLVGETPPAGVLSQLQEQENIRK